MSSDPPIHRLSNELLRHILDQIEPDPERTVPIDDRRFLSVESLEYTPPSDSIKDICRFRATCHRFAQIGAPLLFTLVKVRFCREGLEKLEEFAGWPHLTPLVKKFSYLMPCLYSNNADLRAVGAQNATLGANVKSLQRKANEQHAIIESQEDVRILKAAFKTFKSLQFVKLLPVTEEDDRRFREHVRMFGSLRNFINAYWAPAITHGSRTIGAALLSADVPWSRLYLPVESVESVDFLALPAHASIPILAARLTCLTLVFDEANDLEEKMQELSELFRTVFTTARNMQAVHIGFPRNRPVNLPLEAIFHNVVWDKLVALGVAGWDLSAEEIVNLAVRHKGRLKGLRLRDVHLKDGSMWRDVLTALKTKMERLQWVSLRRIGYVPQLEEMDAGGAEVPDDQPWALSESESDDEADEPGLEPGETRSNGGHPNGNGHVAGSSHEYSDSDGSVSSEEEDEDSNGTDESDDEHEPESDATEFPSLDSPTATAAPQSLARNLESMSINGDDLNDDGYSVSNSKRKAWERWVVSPLIIHEL